jgi:hypothetical protein
MAGATGQCRMRQPTRLRFPAAAQLSHPFGPTRDPEEDLRVREDRVSSDLPCRPHRADPQRSGQEAPVPYLIHCHREVHLAPK